MATCSAMCGAAQVTKTQTLAVLPDVLRSIVHCDCSEGVARPAGDHDPAHLTRITVGRCRIEKALGEPFPADEVL